MARSSVTASGAALSPSIVSAGEAGLHEAQARIAAVIRDSAPLGVAFSGGVDSTVLLAMSVRVLGAQRVRAILGVSPSLPRQERHEANDLAERIGVQIIEIETQEMARPEYVRNGPDRCFHCKDELFTRVTDEVMVDHRLRAIAYGENADDALRRDRPGARAALEHQVLRPLAEAGLGKADVRRIARQLGLPNADKPAAPCLASRLPHFVTVDPEKLAQIERAEAVLRRLGFRELRVRHHGEVARLEFLDIDIERAVHRRAELVSAVRETAGFRFVTIDLDGLQHGAFTLPLLASAAGSSADVPAE